jgi:hypothetical protein
LFATIDRLSKIIDALLDLITKHVFHIDFFSATVDDLVGNLNKERFHSLFSVVMTGEFPDNSDAIQNIRQKFWDSFRLSLTDLSARFLKSNEES